VAAPAVHRRGGGGSVAGEAPSPLFSLLGAPWNIAASLTPHLGRPIWPALRSRQIAVDDSEL
jgi:hypothetical protein